MVEVWGYFYEKHRLKRIYISRKITSAFQFV